MVEKLDKDQQPSRSRDFTDELIHIILLVIFPALIFIFLGYAFITQVMEGGKCYDGKETTCVDQGKP